jgi:hypothetical protein
MKCNNCDNHDPRLFTTDSDNHSGVCMQCGLVQSNDITYCTFDDLVDLIENQCGHSGSDFRSSYQRKVHLTERLREHNRQDPCIPDSDLTDIRREHKRLYRRSVFYRLLADNKRFGKKEIQSLLRSVDRRKKTTKYSRLYLGKYASFMLSL